MNAIECQRVWNAVVCPLLSQLSKEYVQSSFVHLVKAAIPSSNTKQLPPKYRSINSVGQYAYENNCIPHESRRVVAVSVSYGVLPYPDMTGNCSYARACGACVHT